MKKLAVLLAVFILMEVAMPIGTTFEKLAQGKPLAMHEIDELRRWGNNAEITNNIVDGWLRGGKDPHFDFFYSRLAQMDVIPLGESSIAAYSHAGIPTGVLTAITFDTESVVSPGDNGLIDWSAADPQKIVCLVPHTFFFRIKIDFGNNATGYRYFKIIYYNADGTTLYDPGILASVNAVNGIETHFGGVISYPLLPGQYAKLWVYQNSGGDLGIAPIVGYFAIK